MNNRKYLTALIAAAVAGGAHAGDFVDTAQVVSSTPIIERVSEPRQECEATPAQPPSGFGAIAAPILGGILGGVLGHQVGQNSGKTAATIVGATGGAMAGSVLANRTAKPGQSCRTVESMREVIKGYDVVYRYNGRDIATTLPYNPGTTVKVAVGVVEDAAPAYEQRAPQGSRPGPHYGGAPRDNQYSYRY